MEYSFVVGQTSCVAVVKHAQVEILSRRWIPQTLLMLSVSVKLLEECVRFVRNVLGWIEQEMDFN